MGGGGGNEGLKDKKNKGKIKERRMDRRRVLQCASAPLSILGENENIEGIYFKNEFELKLRLYVKKVVG